MVKLSGTRDRGFIKRAANAIFFVALFPSSPETDKIGLFLFTTTNKIREEFSMKAFVTVVGKDRVGIIYGITGVLAKSNVNIEDISQTILQDYFSMVMLVNLDNMTVSFDEIKKQLDEKGSEIGVTVRMQHEDIFTAMHKI